MCTPEIGWSGNSSPPDDPPERDEEEEEIEPQDCDDSDFLDDFDIERAEKDYEAQIHHLK